MAHPHQREAERQAAQAPAAVPVQDLVLVQTLRAAQEAVPIVAVLPAKVARPKQKAVIVAVRELADLEWWDGGGD
jgi:hypothetical protein